MHAINIDQSAEGSVKKDADKCGNLKENCDKQQRIELLGAVLFESGVGEGGGKECLFDIARIRSVISRINVA